MPVVLPSLRDLRPFNETSVGRECSLEEAEAVVSVYCFDLRQLGKSSFEFEKTGRYRAKLRRRRRRAVAPPSAAV
ncbi:hypothetical protein I4F81_010566 [Pyropia yezoensis]|uniref:Uncharacterized protein n=1 Tax=Pyropia yezoensis TaxID=2788 RepID=A0ACC3CDM2_PYRYE|nr:hypothetical protein I4F81_010566 [Neopyropia yezoensis]